MYRRYAVIGVVALVLLSGCSAFGGSGTAGTETVTFGGTASPVPTSSTAESTPESVTPSATSEMEASTPTSTPTATPTPTPTPTATPTATPAGDLEPVSAMSSLPPGVEGGSVTNVTALAVANQQVLVERSYDVRMTFRNSSREGVAKLRIANDTQASLVRFADPSGALGTPTELSLYYDADESGIFNRTSGKISYGHGPTGTLASARFASASAYRPAQAFTTVPDWETAGSYTTDGGEQRLVLRADALRNGNARRITGGAIDGLNEDVQSVAARMEVTPDGLVRTLNFSFTVDPPNGEAFTQSNSYTVRDLEPGSLARPDWLSEPPQLRASTAADDRLLVVEHTGGPDIEAGTRLTVQSDYHPAGDVSADQPITEGDTLYVYATGDRYDKTPHIAVNERPTLPENATAFSGQTELRGSQGNYVFAAGVEIDSDSTDERREATPYAWQP